MALPPKPLTLRKEDYRDAPQGQWLDRLFTELNDWLTPATSALAGGLTRGENARSATKLVKFTTRPAAADTFPLTVKHGLAQRPSAVWVGRLRRTDTTPIADAWSFSWDLTSSGDLSVRFQGLAANAPYEATLLIE